MFDQIKEQAVAWAVACVEPEEIDEIDILNARMKAMQMAIEKLDPKPEFALIDGNRDHGSKCRIEIDHETVVYDGGKYYQVLSAAYDGNGREMREYEYKLGKINLERAKKCPTLADTAWLEGQLAAASRRIHGRLLTCDSTPEQVRDRELAAAIEDILKK